MAALSDSGHRIISTDEYEAMQLRQAKLSLQKTTPIEAVQTNNAIQVNPISPLPPVASDWRPPSVLRQAPSQLLRESMLARTTFGVDHQHSLTEAPLEQFLLFCRKCEVDRGVTRRKPLRF
jgi:hypothetical protein